MSRICIPFSASDISALARSLHTQLDGLDHTPGHLELLNMLARATGQRNYQSLRAQLAARDQLETPEPSPEPVDFVRVRSLARYFDSEGRLKSWPAKSTLQASCLWVIWSRLPSGEPLSEDHLNREIRASHLFGDHALLRRELCDQNLVARTADGREYRRVERPPSTEALALIRRLSARSSNGRSK